MRKKWTISAQSDRSGLIEQFAQPDSIPFRQPWINVCDSLQSAGKLMKLWYLIGVVLLLLFKAIAAESTHTIKNGIISPVNGKISHHRTPLNLGQIVTNRHPHKLNIFIPVHWLFKSKWSLTPLHGNHIYIGFQSVGIYQIIALQISIVCCHANLTHYSPMHSDSLDA